MSNIDNLVETLIMSTENDRIKWLYKSVSESNYISQLYDLSYVSDFLLLDIDGIKICLVKYGSVDEKVDLLLFSNSLNDVKPNLEV